ncbi:hypothetical protein [Uliginosibacterium gangwonense]|uniref:hypothetical protein n=1 Tax=Uliginosibacterium gangwonense TaxID=392736 RepID=UPI00035EE1F0|nr:hypothetical protein [Uliginosibacterium gangwonense]
MSQLKKARAAQWPLVSEFTFSFDDTISDVSGVMRSFGANFADQAIAEIINLPEAAVVIGGEIVVETAGAGPTAYTVSLGDSAMPNRYAAAVDLKTAGRTPLTLTGYRSSENLRLTIGSTVANATAGKATVRVMYTIPGRANETVPN